MHRVADPRDLGARGGDALHQLRQHVEDAVLAHPGDEGEPAGLAGRVQLVDQGEGDVRGGGRAQLDRDRVAHLRGVLDVRAVQLPGPLADPEHVAGDGVRAAGPQVGAGEGALVVQQQRLVAREDRGGVELLRVRAARLQEGQRVVDVPGQALVPLADRRAGHEVPVPLVHLAQVGVAAGGEGADQVERRGGGVVHPLEPLRVRRAGLGGELQAVDRIPTVGGEFDTVPDLGGLRARLGVLPGDPADLHHRYGGGVGQHGRHLQQGLDLVAHLVGRDAVEGLGAVAALQDERLAPRHPRDLLAEFVALTGEDQRRVALQFGGHGPERGLVGVDGLLSGGQVSPGVRRRKGLVNIHDELCLDPFGC